MTKGGRGELVPLLCDGRGQPQGVSQPLHVIVGDRSHVHPTALVDEEVMLTLQVLALGPGEAREGEHTVLAHDVVPGARHRLLQLDTKLLSDSSGIDH